MTALRETTASRLTSEFVGTGFLLLSVVGSGIMAERLSPDDVGLQLLENSMAAAGALLWVEGRGYRSVSANSRAR